ncbi:MAG: AAA family ATPase [Kiloniellales bacterium]|nr:AAA family ATPase [Kiloniellales bacterium]
MARRNRETKLPSPFLKRIIAQPEVIGREDGYPFDLPWLQEGAFELDFTTPVTIVVGENGSGKSSLIEAIAALAGYDEAGGGKGYRPVDHESAIDRSGALLAEALRAQWLPKVTTGWFFRAETFFSVARYLDHAAMESGGAPPDFLSWSHGEGFIRFFEERCARQGLYFMDEPESALSPRRQLELLRILDGIHRAAKAQVIIATHSPLLMALPCARLLEITRSGLLEIDFTETDHFRLYREFITDPAGFIEEALAAGDSGSALTD